MISASRIKLALAHERAHMRWEGTSDFISGIIYGLRLAEDKIDILEAEKLTKPVPADIVFTPYALYCAISTALNYLWRGEPGKARRRLQKIVAGRSSHVSRTRN